MRSTRFAKLSLVAVAAVVLTATLWTLTKNYAGLLIPSDPIALGVQVEAPAVGAEIEGYTAKVGAKPSHVLLFRNWQHGFNQENEMDAAAEENVAPIVTWQPMVLGGGDDQPKYATRKIAAGDHDAYVRRWAREAAAWDKTFYLRPMHEMNGTWSPWGVGINGNTSESFIAAWRHIHDIFEQEEATNVRWVWSPNIAYSKSTPFREVYPGDAYVDWVALDGYNWGTSKTGHSWRSMVEVFGPSYDTLAKMTGKPMMITETASSEAGGDKAAWIRRGFLESMPTKFPRVVAVTWFDKDKEIDWRIDSSPASLEAYKKVAVSPEYQGRLP